MGNFKKRSKTSQEIPTSALPDIIFILLFFFIVVTKKRPNELKVENRIPKVTQIEKLENMNRVVNIYIGAPQNKAAFGKEPKIQINDRFAEVEDLGQFIEQKRTDLGKYRDQLIVSLKVDKKAKMGIVTDVEQKLRKVDARVINYNSIKGSDLE